MGKAGAGSGLTVVFVGPLLACFEQLAACIRREGVRTVWIGYPYGHVRRLRSRLFIDHVATAYDVQSLAAALLRIGPESISDIQASEHVLVDTAAAARLAGVRRELLGELDRRVRLGDKLVMSRALEAAGVRVPCALGATETTPDQAVAALGLPLVVKGRLANGGVTVHIAQTLDAVRHAAAVVAPFGGAMYEQFVAGRTVSYVASYDGEGRVLHEGAYLSSRVGHADVAPPDRVVTLHRPAHQATGRAVLALIGGSGLVNMNMIEDDEGHGWVHDVNLRPWGTVVALRRAGVDFTTDYLHIHGGRRGDDSRALRVGQTVDVFPSAVLGLATLDLRRAAALYARLVPRYLRWTGPGYVLAETIRSVGIVCRDRLRARRRPL